ncbi:maltotransferase domain-containing protein [Telmatospirillum sp. J64-1]|uniref:maltotransferase domain-containing protein n=1 Tax=Telmatospirillum sp. J64-1 TaxID=2502183 RepID=UPI002107AB54|nr:maltotransferase domain-containing protein [Telmatospirillum sp. J64-1]
MEGGPRIYDLFPLLVGKVEDWREHLPRIAAMGFDWVYINPFHYPGFSGSLYAVKDYYRLHPLMGGGDDPARALADFTHAARDNGLKVMMDLVVNHTAKDALLVEEHPDWYKRRADGSILSPGAVDPNDPTIFTEWGDLAEIDYDSREKRPELVDYWAEVARHHAGLGFSGFRCDAAYKVPAEVWSGIIKAAREVRPDAVFAAETLGCRIEETEALAAAGFDYLFNSSKWWNFREPWLLEQYERSRRIAPSIAFPESHDTRRLANEIPPGEDVEGHYRLRALFAAFFSAGWMMPIGYEFGFRRDLHVVETRPEHWEKPSFDLQGFVTAVNAMKAAIPALNQEGPMEDLTGLHGPVRLILRSSEDGTSRVLAAINPDPRHSQSVDLAGLLKRSGLSLGAFEDATPGRAGGPLPARLTLKPLEMRVLRHPPARRDRSLPDEGKGMFQEGGAMAMDDSASAQGEQSALPPDLPATRSQAVLIEGVWPELDDGRFPVKREVGDMLEVSADIYKDGHDRIAAVVLYKEKGTARWHEVPMRFLDNDRWVGRFKLERNTRYLYTIEAWADRFGSWRSEVAKKREAGQIVSVELLEGRAMVEAAIERCEPEDAERLRRVLHDFDAAESDEDRYHLLESVMVHQIMNRYPDRSRAVRYDRVLEVIVDRVQARFAAWYEMFHRSQGKDPNRAATFRECEERLPDIAAMGFDVVYLLPIHPIGKVHRKGPNNTLTPSPNDPGSPYAIGSDEGGHKAVHPDYGTIEDFRHFVGRCHELGMEVALDFAIQCAPDHPYIREHPEWFEFRPDGTIKYAENPPKKYQDIVNVNFYGEGAATLWQEWLDVVLYWVDQGVKIFRVDNPHTKPVPFWEWLIGKVQEKHPDVIFLSEAFTKPKMMKMLAKVGFTQSYTYFTWRNFKNELIEYMTELAQSEQKEYFRPNFFPTTPDILPPFLQTGGRPAFRIRFILAATLSSVYGIYNGYELCENAAIPGKEEYLNSEKYEYKVWDWDRPGNIKDEIRKVNLIRRDNPALHEFENTRFYQADDDNILFYGKMTHDRSNMIFVAVNLDPFDPHEAVLHFPLEEMGVPPGETFEVEELLTGRRHLWRGERHRIRLDPEENPAVLFRITVWNSVDYRTPCF